MLQPICRIDEQKKKQFVNIVKRHESSQVNVNSTINKQQGCRRMQQTHESTNTKTGMHIT
jgi:hypothetical protein